MRRILFTGLDAIAAALLLAPIFWVLDRRYFRNPKRTVWYFVLAVYLSGVYAVVGLPDILYMRLDFHINLVPFAYMFSDLKNSLLNVLLFVPLGFFLPVLWKRFKKLSWTLLFGMCASLLIELLQFLTFRATDINDLITNSVGTVVGWCLARILLKLVPSIQPGWKTREVYIVCAAVFAVMFFLQPFLANLLFPFL